MANVCSTWSPHRHRGHTLMELVVAMAAGSFLIAGLGSVMFIGRQIAYTPTDSTRRTTAGDVASQLCDELRYATYIVQHSATILDFVVADRNADGTAERIRYEWSGVAGEPLRKSLNGSAAVNILTSVNSFAVTLQTTQKSTNYTTTTDSSDQLLWTTAAGSGSDRRDIDASNHMAQVIAPTAFGSVPANALSWNLTRVDFYGRQNSSATETLAVQIRHAGDPSDSPTSHVLSQVVVPESFLTSSDGWNIVTLPTAIRDLSLNRRYALVLAQPSGAGSAARISYSDSTATGVTESTDGGATWKYMPTRQMYAKFYGSYTTPGSTYNIVRSYVSQVRIALQTGSQGFSRIDASAPLPNMPELLSAYWRTDFDRNPAATNVNGDAVADWAVAGGGSFDTNQLANGIWTATSAIETRPLSDFATTTTVDVRCRNTSTGGNGAVLRINADRQGGQYGPILVYVRRQADGTQSLVLSGKTSDAATRQLFLRANLPSGFVRYQLTILPANNLVNLQINGEDQGTYTYPTYVPTNTTDGYVTLFANVSSAEFDYVDVRVGTN